MLKKKVQDLGNVWMRINKINLSIFIALGVLFVCVFLDKFIASDSLRYTAVIVQFILIVGWLLWKLIKSLEK